MFDMRNEPQLPIPDVTAWTTRQWAAKEIGVSVRSVDRMVKSGTLRAYTPHVVDGEQAPVLLFKPEVEDVAEARRRLGHTPTGEEMGAVVVGSGARAKRARRG